MQRILLSIWLILTTLSVAPASVHAQDTPFETTIPHAVLLDARTGKILFEKGADTAVPPASMSKLMTMIMVFEALKAGKMTLDQEILISEDAWRRGGASSGGSTMYAELNSKVKLSDLIQGVIVQSANDACIAIAETISGNEPAFSDRMTKRAQELGFASASFRNATGLPDPDHRVSVRDLAGMARYIIVNFPEYYHYYSQPSFTWNKINQSNRNPLLKDYPGADGMKTGYTKEAGYGLVGSATRGDRRLIMVLAGAKSINERKLEAQKLLDWGFSQFKTFEVYDKGERVSRATVWGGVKRRVELRATESVSVTLTPAEQAIVEVKLAYDGPLIAPVEQGQKVGKLRFIVDGVLLDEVPVETSEAVEADPSMWSRALDSLLIMVFGS